MYSTPVTIFLILSAITVVIDFIVARLSFRNNTTKGKTLGRVVTLAALVCITYSASIVSSSHFYFSMWSSIYFSCITWMLVVLLKFTILYTKIDAPLLAAIRKFTYIYASIESAVFVTNPFHEIAIGYRPITGSLVSFEYDTHMLYSCHLIFSYMLVALVLLLLIQKGVSVPSQYRKKFIYLVYGIISVVAINAAFLFFSSKYIISVLDCSLFTYSLVIIMIYWFAFPYSSKNMLEGLSLSVFGNLDQGIILFDYDGVMVLHNNKAEQFFSPDIPLDQELTIRQFLVRAGISISRESMEENRSIQCHIRKSQLNIPVRCDYTYITDRRGKTTGYLLVFTDLEMETDLLTEFHNWEYFSHYVSKNPEAFELPMGVAAFDINNLGLINSSLGKDAGDNKLAALARSMRECFGTETYFVRREAVLFGLCYNTSGDKLLKDAIRVKEDFDGRLQFATAMTSAEHRDIIEVINDAYKTLRTKKLLDRDSTRSQALTSLIRALQESDEDTEAHVQRTQHMGQALGELLGLNDTQLSDLSLLCLLHDIGKIGIPLEILNKPGRLTEEEWRVLQTHVEKGYQIAMSSREFSHIAQDIRCHHERWDGKGYPAGLTRESIPLLARIISVIDSFDAMTNDRPYRKGMPINKAFEELRRNAGKQFDPHITSQFIKMVSANPEEFVSSAPEESSFISTVNTGLAHSQQSAPSKLQYSHRVLYSKYTLDANNFIVATDSNFHLITGYLPEDLADGTFNQVDLLPEEDKSAYASLVSELIAKYETAFVEHRIQCKNGDIIYVLCYGRVYFDSAAKEQRSEVLVCKVTDTNAVRTIAEVADSRARNRLAQWENTFRQDTLTELLNRQAFQNDLEQEILASNYKILLMMVDIDNFKNYNDTYGHKAGDEHLIYVANTIKSALREGDLACRMGGDEFACALFFKKDMDNDTIYQRAHQFFDRISLSLNMKTPSTSASMGAIISSEDDKQTFSDLYQLADEKLYESKNKGRGRLTV